MAKTEEKFSSDFHSMIRVASLSSFGFFYLGFLVPIIARTNMDASSLQIGLMVSSLVIGHLISSSFTGYLTDRVKQKKVLIFWGSMGRGISYLMIYFAIINNSFIILWISWFSLGFGAGFFWIPFDTLIAEKSHKENRSQAFGKRDSANARGQLFGALGGFAIILFFGPYTQDPRILYSAIIFFGIANFIAAVLFIEKVDETLKILIIEENLAKNDLSPADNVSKTSFPKPMVIGLIILFIIVILSSINANLWRPFLNIYIIENVSSNLNVIILIYLPAGLLATFFAPKLGEIMDKVNPTIGITITAIIGALLTWLLINTTDLLLFALIVLADITISMAAGLLFRNLLSRIHIENRGKILGVTTFFTNLGAIIGPIIGGYLWDIYGSKTPFILSIYVELCLVPLFLIVIKLLSPHLAEKYENKKNNS
ncbi:MAG: MFS transporter [Promethearchaeota archaeon]